MLYHGRKREEGYTLAPLLTELFTTEGLRGGGRMANGKEEMRDQGCKECLIRGKKDKNGKRCNFRDKIKDKMPRTLPKLFALVEILLMPLSGRL